MALFDDLKKKVADTTQGAVRGARDITDSARYNSLISDEQKSIANMYGQIGKYFYEHCTEQVESPLKEMCESIAASNVRIASYQLGLQQIRGMKTCANCGTEIPIAAPFCSNCGAQAAEVAPAPAAPEKAQPEKFCVNCGNRLEPGAAFCLSCGRKV
ncbi:MAG: zinc ribbon domain-containing protein [Clostridiales bacterium]|jgi:predicted nucleic acid-binding Zn ribbon protein|nr:zinc ribbon domain-containing protein [Clostridiales bacterium]